ncbi:MAG: choice-of-anchor J domain-containing protein [Flavobacteriales bacterium]
MKNLLVKAFTALMVMFSAQTFAQNLNESFEGTFLPDGWETVNHGTSTTWFQTTTTPQNGLKSARINSGAHDDWLITPKLEILSSTDSLHFWAKDGSSSSSVAVSIKLSTTGNDTSSFNVVLDTTLTVDNTWEKFSYGLGAYTGQNVYVALHSNPTSFTTFYVDNFTGPMIYNDPCPTVDDVEFSDLGSNTVTASWTSLPTDDQYSYMVFEAGQGPSGTPLFNGLLSDTFITVNGLTPVTDYEFWLETSCGGGVLSENEGPFYFTTLCGDEIVEYTNDFSTYPGQCWTEAKGDLIQNTVFTNTTSSFWTADGFGNVGSSGAAAVNIFSTNRREWLISPSFNLDSISNSEISFYAAVTGYYNSNAPSSFGGDDTVHVVISTDNGITWSSDNIIYSFHENNYPSNTGDFYNISLAAYSGIVKIGFYAESTVSNADNLFFIDNFQWSEPITCLPLSGVEVDSTTSTQGFVSWNNPNNYNNFIIEYGVDGFDLGSGTQMNVTDSFAVVSGLEFITEYEYYVRAVCSVGDSSDWSAAVSFTTECGAETTAYEQSFSSVAPTCWSEARGVIDDTTDFTATFASWTEDGFLNVGSSDAARVNISGTSRREWLITNSFNLDSIANSEISFYAGLTDAFNSNAPESGNFGPDDKVHVVISLDNGVTWSDDNILMTFDTLNLPSHTGSYYTIPLSSYSGIVKFGFYAESTVSNESNDFFINDFKWDEESNCLPVSSISEDSIFSDNVYVSWTNPNSIDNFVIEYGEDGFDLGTGTMITSTDTFVQITGLLANTEYDYYIRTVCSVGDSSLWSVESEFQTECADLTTTHLEEFASYIPDCWSEGKGLISDTTVFTSTSSLWTADGFLNSGTTGSAKMNVYGSNRREWLFSPTINLDSIPNSQITYYTALTDFGNGNAPESGNFGPDDKVHVVISLDNGATWSDDNILLTYDTNNVPPHTGKYEVIDLSAYSGRVKIGFYGESTALNEDNDFFIDNFTWEEIPTCLPIANIVLDSIFSSDVYFSATNLNTSDNLIIEYGEDGFTQGSGTVINLSDTAIHISGLQPVTTYQMYVQNVCAPGDTSTAVFPITFTTECAISTSTYAQNFSSYIPLCWEEAKGAIDDTTVFTSTTSSLWTQDGFLNNGTTGSARINITGTSRRDWLISSSLNLDAISNSQVSFIAGLTDAFNSNAPESGTFGPDDKVHVVISLDDGVTWSDANTILTFDTANTPSHLGQYYAIDLSAFSGIVKIGFYAESTVSNESNDFFIDDFLWSEAPSCAQVSLLSLDNVFATTATLSWDNPNAASSFIIEYGTPGFTLGTGTAVNANSVPFEVTGLSPNTTYEAYVTTVCSPGDTATWSLSTYLTTTCLEASAFFTEDFDEYVPLCWEEATGDLPSTGSVALNVGTSNWREDGYLNNGTLDAARINVYGTSLNAWLISQAFDLDAQSNSQIEFDAGLTDFGNSGAPENGNFDADDRIHVVISTDQGQTWSETNTLMTFDQSNLPSHLGQHYTLPLGAYTGKVKIGFYAISSSSAEDNDFFVDNFEWSAENTCLPVTFYNVHDVFDAEATVSWNNLGSASNFAVEYGETGFTPGSGTTVLSTDTFTELSGLNANTSYQVYVRPICGSGDTAVYNNSVMFQTECASLENGDLEGFNSFVPECWSEAKGTLSAITTFTSTSSSWSSDGYLNVGTTGAARVNVWGTSHREWLISPTINLDSSPKQIEFDAGMTDFSNTNDDDFGPDDKFQVVISTDDGITWSDANVLMTFNDTDTLSNAGDHYIISLQAYSGNVKIGFYTESTVSNKDYNVYVDNFEVVDVDLLSNDVTIHSVIVAPFSCIGASSPMSLFLNNYGANPTDSFALNVNITGPSTFQINQDYAFLLDTNTFVSFPLTNLDTFAIGVYSGTAIISNPYDTIQTNDTVEFNFEIMDYPVVDAGLDAELCPGGEYLLNATGATNYTWSGGLNNGDFVSPTVTTDYIVTGTNAAGCEDTDTITITVIPSLQPVILFSSGELASGFLHDTYNWLLNGISVGNTQQITPTENGVYTLVVTNANGCSGSVDYTVQGIGVDEFNTVSVSIYPNPTQKEINVLSENDVEDIEIFDLSGRKVLELPGKLNGAIDVAHLGEGYYILKAYVNGKEVQTKFSKL